MPAYANETFRHWFARHIPVHPDGPEVILFPDTFNNFFRPDTAIAAVHVLEKAGWRVSIPPRLLCCARPLYDWGMLERADALLRELLDALEPALARGTPIVGLEPACVAAFRDEVFALFPDDERARRLKEQSFLISEFLDDRAKQAPLPKHGGRKALVQMHCHEHAVLRPEAEANVLQRIGISAEVMASGCCGMAGSFGFEAKKYPWSVRIAEHALLPRLARAERDAVIVVNGFSCREQIEQLTGRPTRHIAEVLADAMGVATPPVLLPPSRARQLAAAGVVVGTGVLLGGFLARPRRASGTAGRTGPALQSDPGAAVLR